MTIATDRGGSGFATAISCIDGRVHLPLITWMQQHFGVRYVDLMTEPGADGLLAQSPDRGRELLKAKAALSEERHASQVVVVAAHFDCLGNPVPEETHREHVRGAVDAVQAWDLGVQVMGVWVTGEWQVEIVKSRSPKGS